MSVVVALYRRFKQLLDVICDNFLFEFLLWEFRSFPGVTKHAHG